MIKTDVQLAFNQLPAEVKTRISITVPISTAYDPATRTIQSAGQTIEALGVLLSAELATRYIGALNALSSSGLDTSTAAYLIPSLSLPVDLKTLGDAKLEADGNSTGKINFASYGDPARALIVLGVSGKKL